MSPRLPLLLLAAIVGGSGVAVSADGARPTLLVAPPPVPGVAAPVASPEDSLTATWYCAGGTAAEGGFADHRVTVVNPTDDVVRGRLTVFPGGVDTVAAAAPAPTAHGFAVAGGERASFRLADLQPARLASAVVEVDHGGVVVEHQVVGPQGQDGAPCASAAASEWHLAWGSTARDARELLILFNPFPSSVTVDTTFVTEAGARQPLRWQGLTVPAHGVVAMEVGQDVTRRDHVAATIRARGGRRVVVDRLQGFDGTAGRRGLDLSLGQPVGAEVSAFAGGRVDDGASEQVVLYNPGPRPAEVEVAVQGTGAAAQPHPFGVVVRPGRYEVVDYGIEDRVPRGIDHMTVIRSLNGVPVVAERVSIGDGVVSAAPAALFAARRWVVGAPAEGESLAIANPDLDRTAIVWTRLVRGGARQQRWEVPAAGRLTVPLPRGDDAVAVVSHTPVIVERVDGSGGAAAPAIPTADGLRAL